MPVEFTATAEPEQGRVKIEAMGGVIGESFYLVRRDVNGSALVRETSEASRTWEAAPDAMKTNLMRNPSMEKPGVRYEVLRNLFRNPNMVPSTTATVLRRNLVPKPSAEVLAETIAWLGEYAGGNGRVSIKFGGGAVGGGYAQQEWTSPAADTPGGNSFGGFFLPRLTGIVAGAKYVVSGYMQTSIAQTMHIRVDFRNSSGGLISQVFSANLALPAWTPPANGQVSKWHRINLETTAPAGTTQIDVNFFASKPAGVAWPAGSWLRMDGAMVEQNGVVGDTYFDGSSGSWITDEGLMYAEWEGAPFNSVSKASYRSVPNLLGNDKSHVRAFAGSAGIIPRIANNNDTYTELGFTPGQLAMGMVRGRQYTASAQIQLTKVLAGTLSTFSRRIVAMFEDANGAVTNFNSNPAPNTIGTHSVTLTFTVPANAVTGWIRVYNGASLGNGILQISKFSLTETPAAPPFFSGDGGLLAPKGKYEYVWSGTPNDSESIAYVVGAEGINRPLQAYGIQTDEWATRPGGKSLEVVPRPGSTDNNTFVFLDPSAHQMQAGKIYTVYVKVRLTAAQTGTLHANARRLLIRTDIGDFISAPFPNTAGTHEIRYAFQMPAAPGITQIWLYNGAAPSAAARVFYDDLLIVEGAYGDTYFDGSTDNPDFSGWDGTPHASTSYKYFRSQVVTLYDYEAQQGRLVEYSLASAAGQDLGTGVVRIDLPLWGTWIKDPFRPFMNCKVLYNSDEAYTRNANRTLLHPRGAKFPVAQWERRSSIEGGFNILTETNDDARNLDELLEETGVVLLDTDPAFNVPVRYVSVGDISTTRAVSDKLSDPHRLWSLPITEVAMPQGAPVGLSNSYQKVQGYFRSYIEIPAALETYNDLLAGGWA